VSVSAVTRASAANLNDLAIVTSLSTEHARVSVTNHCQPLGQLRKEVPRGAELAGGHPPQRCLSALRSVTFGGSGVSMSTSGIRTSPNAGMFSEFGPLRRVSPVCLTQMKQNSR
jgi:hypothetical protein